MIKLSHLIAVVPVAVLLTLSFFVLYTLSKITEKSLRAFGYVVVGFLWLAALVVFSGAVYKTAQGSMGNKDRMQQKMKMDCMPQMMQKDSPEAVIFEVAPGVKMASTRECQNVKRIKEWFLRLNKLRGCFLTGKEP